MASPGPRGIALQVMLQLFERGRSLDDIFASEWYRGLSGESRDLALSRELAYGLCRWYYRLAALLAQRLDKPLRKRDRDVEIILLLGLYQLLVMRTPPHAAVNETVAMARQRRKSWARSLINAVLRGVVRDGVALDDDPAAAYPGWMRARIESDWGERAVSVMAAGNARAPMTLRVDTHRVGREDMLRQMSELGIEARAHDIVPCAITLASPCSVERIPGFAEGRVSVQDAAAQLAAILLDAEPGQHVLDACAAPGGKTAHLLQCADDLRLDALDSDASRLESVSQNLRRIGRDARLIHGDAGAPDDWFDGEYYDRILVDAPCSASGVIRRHPDIKLLRRESDIINLVERQRRIMDACWQLLKPGGKMLYSTCSIFRAENESQVEAFLHRHAGAAEIPLRERDWGQLRQPGRQIPTGDHDMDGFYYALLQRTSD
jgi:16S rRNA (cytosine967-C5)-methyltransferase